MAPHLTWPLPNVAIGTSVENQKWAGIRIPELLETPAAVRFLSMEPLLGPVDLRRVRAGPLLCPSNPDHRIDVLRRGYWDDRLGFVNHSDMETQIDWVIVGGESGQGDIRPMHPDWVRSLRDQCADGGIRFLFKQWGGHEPKLLQWLPGAGEGKPQPEQRFVRHTQWVNKAQSWLSRGDICVDLEGRVCRIGEDFQEARYPIAVMRRSSKKAAGRTLDGVVHDEFPAAWDDWMKEARSGKGGRSEARGKGRGKARGKTRKQRDPAPSPAGAG